MFLHTGGACSGRAGEGFLMRAILRTGFGRPDVLVIREISEPEPKEGVFAYPPEKVFSRHYLVVTDGAEGVSAR
jgi:hypothetical protein